jgi:hypothetical protein
MAMTATINICEDVEIKHLRQLATVTVLQAIEDAQRARKLEKRLDALMWLTSDDALWWCEWAGLSFANVWKILTEGTARKARTGRSAGRYG